MATIKKIIWNENNSGGFKATCGGLSVGGIKKSLTNKKIYYPSILNDKFKLKKEEFNDLDEAKRAFEEAFEHIIGKFINVK